MKRPGLILAMLLASVLAAPAFAQGAQVPFGGLRADPNAPVEISADNLEVSQSDGTATFTGNVVIGQGEMRLSAGKVRVEYAEEEGKTGQIRRLHASEGVTLVSGEEAAEAKEAVYSIAEATVVMTGGVLLTQGPNVISGDKLTVNLETGTGRMDGRVKTVLKPQGGNN